MDTRAKIVTTGHSLVSDRPITLVTGYFDVLRTSHIAALHECVSSGYALCVAVQARAGEILPLRARAELVAALRMVDYVVIIDNGDLDGLVTSLKPARTIALEEDDLVRASELKLHVQQRQSC